MRNQLVVIALLAGVSPAGAHALLESATPPVGSEVASAPAVITLDFSEALEPRFSTVTVAARDGTQVDRHDLHTVPGNAKRLVLGVAKLADGTYTVRWHATSVDSHKTEGSYRFTVGRQ